MLFSPLLVYIISYSTFDFTYLPYFAPSLLDATFGSGGEVTTPINSRGNSDWGRSILIQPDGKIVASGYSDASIHTFSNSGNDESFNGARNDFALARYTSAGVLDTSFGTSGKTTTDIGTDTDDKGNAAALQPDGKIVVAGTSSNDFALARYGGTVPATPTPTATNTPTSTPTSTPVAVVNVNHTTGAPNSFFTFQASGFPANATATIFINNVLLTTVQTDGTGLLAFTISTSNLPTGTYTVRVEVNPTATVTFAIDSNAPLRANESGAPVFAAPPEAAQHKLYLPQTER